MLSLGADNKAEAIHMSASTFIDFADLKTRISIHQVMTMLGMTLKQQGAQYRGPCPIHGGGDRAMVVTPAKGVFYCFAEKKGGDQIALCSHVREVPVKDAARAIAEHYGTVPLPAARNSTIPGNSTSPSDTVPQGQAVQERPREALRPLDYLQPEHEAVQALGVSPEACTAFGSGYAPKGILRGRLAIPIHDHTGQKLLAYVGRAIGDEEPRLAFPKNFEPGTVIFNAHRVQRGDFAYLASDPLEVLKAHDNGVENVVACLGVLDADFLQVLSLWMDEHQIESIEPL
jgi:DNA primase